MAVSKAQICNLALAHINQTESQIANLDTDKGNTASQCRIHYDIAREFVLADHPWNFAGKRVALADLGNPPAIWTYRYDYPSDALRIRAIQPPTRQSNPIVFKVEDDGTDSGLCILTDQDEAVCEYTRNVKNTALFTPGFVQALSWYLASELAPALTGDLNKQEACLTVYRNHLAAAQAVDSDEGIADPELQSPWEQARISGSSSLDDVLNLRRFLDGN